MSLWFEMRNFLYIGGWEDSLGHKQQQPTQTSPTGKGSTLAHRTEKPREIQLPTELGF